MNNNENTKIMNKEKIIDLLKIHIGLAGSASCFLGLIKSDHFSWVGCLVGGNVLSVFFVFVIYVGICGSRLFTKQSWKKR